MGLFDTLKKKKDEAVRPSFDPIGQMSPGIDPKTYEAPAMPMPVTPPDAGLANAPVMAAPGIPDIPDASDPGDDHLSAVMSRDPSTAASVFIATHAIDNFDPIAQYGGEAAYDAADHADSRRTQQALKAAGVNIEHRANVHKKNKDIGKKARDVMERNGTPMRTMSDLIKVFRAQSAGFLPPIDDAYLAELVQAMSFSPMLKQATAETLSNEGKTGLLGYAIGQVLSGGGAAGLAGASQALGSAVATQQQGFDTTYKNAVAAQTNKIDALKTGLSARLDRYRTDTTLLGQVAPTLIGRDTQLTMQDRQIAFDRWATLSEQASREKIATASNEIEKEKYRQDFIVRMLDQFKTLPMEKGFGAVWAGWTPEQRASFTQTYGAENVNMLLSSSANELTYKQGIGLVLKTQADIKNTNANTTVQQAQAANIKESTRLMGAEAQARINQLNASAEAARASANRDNRTTGAMTPAEVNAMRSVIGSGRDTALARIGDLDKAIDAFSREGAGWTKDTKLDPNDRYQVSSVLARIKVLTPAQAAKLGLTAEGGGFDAAKVTEYVTNELFKATIGENEWNAKGYKSWRDVKGLKGDIEYTRIGSTVGSALAQRWQANAEYEELSRQFNAIGSAATGAFMPGDTDPKP